MNPNKKTPFRSWLYFRTGYSLYFAMLVGAMNTLILIYFVVGDPDKVHWIRVIFPHFFYFTAFAILVGGPIMIGVGWLHFKKEAYKSETDVMIEAHPYTYRMPPGHASEISWPLQRYLIDFLLMQTLSPKERNHLHEIRNKLDVLLKGGNVGKPE